MDGSARADMQALPASTRYRAYVLTVLIAVGIMGWVDRNMFAVLLQSIKVEFALSDTSMGLLGGVAFGLFYATLGLPVAWLADRAGSGSEPLARYPERLGRWPAVVLLFLFTALELA